MSVVNATTAPRNVPSVQVSPLPRLGKTVVFRPLQDQATALQHITDTLQDSNPEINQSDVMRAAMDHFIEAWRAQNKQARAAVENVRLRQ